MKTVLNLLIAFSKMAAFSVLMLPTRVYVRSVHLLVSSPVLQTFCCLRLPPDFFLIMFVTGLLAGLLVFVAGP